MACVQVLYLVVDLLHSGIIPGLMFGLICGAEMEHRTLYILAVLFHLGPVELPNCFLHRTHSFIACRVVQTWRKSLWKIVLFSHLCGQAVWELEPEPPAWAAQFLCREQDWRKVLLLSEASAHTLSLLLPFPFCLRLSEFKIISWGWSREDAPSTGLLGLPQELCGPRELRRSQWRESVALTLSSTIY